MKKYINEYEIKKLHDNLKEFIYYKKIKIEKRKIENFKDIKLDFDEAIDFYYTLINNDIFSNNEYTDTKYSFAKYLKNYGCNEKIIDLLIEHWNDSQKEDYDILYIDDIVEYMQRLISDLWPVDSINYTTLSECMEVPEYFSTIKANIDEVIGDDVPLDKRADEFYQLVESDGYVLCILNYEMDDSYLYKISNLIEDYSNTYCGVQNECYVEDGNTYIIFSDYNSNIINIATVFFIISILLRDGIRD